MLISPPMATPAPSMRHAPAVSKPGFQPYVSASGGVLGGLRMRPRRRVLIVKEHGILPYPEGTACGEVLVAGEKGGKLAALVFGGLGVGALWKALSWVFNLFRTEV